LGAEGALGTAPPLAAHPGHLRFLILTQGVQAPTVDLRFLEPHGQKICPSYDFCLAPVRGFLSHLVLFQLFRFLVFAFVQSTVLQRRISAPKTPSASLQRSGKKITGGILSLKYNCNRQVVEFK